MVRRYSHQLAEDASDDLRYLLGPDLAALSQPLGEGGEASDVDEQQRALDPAVVGVRPGGQPVDGEPRDVGQERCHGRSHPGLADGAGGTDAARVRRHVWRRRRCQSSSAAWPRCRRSAPDPRQLPAVRPPMRLTLELATRGQPRPHRPLWLRPARPARFPTVDPARPICPTDSTTPITSFCETPAEADGQVVVHSQTLPDIQLLDQGISLALGPDDSLPFTTSVLSAAGCDAASRITLQLVEVGHALVDRSTTAATWADAMDNLVDRDHVSVRKASTGTYLRTLPRQVRSPSFGWIKETPTEPRAVSGPGGERRSPSGLTFAAERPAGPRRELWRRGFAVPSTSQHVLLWSGYGERR